MNAPPLNAPYDVGEANLANTEWGFNCGPAAYGAVTRKSLAEIHEAFRLAGFLEKGYTNPTMMRGLVRGVMKVLAEFTGPQPAPAGAWAYPPHGLVRVQWGGRWTGPGVPMKARYRHTHWIAADGDYIFDVNCLCVGGWVPREEWEKQVAPWLIRECAKGGDGSWWPTHIWAIERPVRGA